MMSQLNIDSKISKTDYLIATLFFACGGNGLIIGYQWYAFVIVLVMYVLCKKRNIKMPSKVLAVYLLALLMIAVLQYMTLPKVSSPAYFNFAAKLVAGCLMISFLGCKFRMAYLRVCTFFCAISLVFWAIHLVHPFTFGIPVERSKSFVAWSYFVGTDSFRNQGMFWEPGAFQGYIMMVPIVFIDKLKEIWRNERRSCLILIAALATTMSTTGYVVFAFLVGMYLIKGINNVLLKFVFVMAFVFGSVYAYYSFDFLGEKISSQYENAVDLDYGDSGVMQGRMSTMFIDAEIIKNHPIIGNSFDNDMKYGVYADIMAFSGNGLTGFMTTLGIPFLLLYLIGLYRSRFSASPYFRFVALGAICLVFYGESFYNFIPYWGLLFATYRQDDYLIY